MFAVPAAVAASRPAGAHRGKLYLAAFILIIMIGLRREVGGDWYNYLDMLRDIRMGDLASALRRTEIGYGLLNWIAARAGLGIWFPNLACAMIFTWGLIALCRQQPNPMLAIVVAIYLVVLVGMGYTRQSAALGFVMVALARYLRGSTPWAFIYLVLAATFHTSSLIVLPLVGLAAARRGVMTIALLAALAVFLYFQLSGRIAGKLDIYTRHAYEAGGAVPRLMLNVLPAAIFLAFRTQFSRTVDESRVWTIFSITAFSTLVALFFIESSLIVDRIGLYLTPLQIVVLSRAPYVFGGRQRASMFLVALVIVYSLTLTVGWLTLGRWGSAWLPYRNYVWDWSPPTAREGLRARY